MTRFIINEKLIMDNDFDVQIFSKDEFVGDKMAARILKNYYQDDDDDTEENKYFDLDIFKEYGSLEASSNCEIECVEFYIVDEKLKIVSYYNDNHYITQLFASATVVINVSKNTIEVRLLSCSNNYDYN